jgi:chemotaxis response regulator CheB
MPRAAAEAGAVDEVLPLGAPAAGIARFAGAEE